MLELCTLWHCGRNSLPAYLSERSYLFILLYPETPLMLLDSGLFLLSKAIPNAVQKMDGLGGGIVMKGKIKNTMGRPAAQPGLERKRKGC